MKKRKRNLSLLIAAAIMLQSLAGCGAQKGGTENGGTSKNVQTAAAEESGKGTNEKKTENGLLMW